MSECRWGDVCTLSYGKALRDYIDKPTEETPVRVFGTNGPIGWTSDPLCSEPGIIVGRKGAYRGIHYSDAPFFVIDTAYYLKLITSEIDIKWAYYKLLTVDINRMDVGAAIPTTNRDEFYSLPLSYPNKEEQISAASTLSAYDDLIENNRRRIKLLEQAARLLYKEWFVRLRFPGHKHVKIKDGVPEGWVKKPLGEIAPLKYGKALKQADRIPGPFSVYGSSGIIGRHAKALIEGPGIIVGRKGNVGSVYWSEENFHPIDTVYFIGPEKSSLYLYYALLHTAFISTDVAVPGLNRDFAHSRRIMIPDSKIARYFEKIVSIAHKQIYGLQNYNLKLAEARDLLLPRLMNGEIVL